MGGALTLWLANKYPEIAGIVLINAALRVPCYEYLKGKQIPGTLMKVHLILKKRM